MFHTLFYEPIYNLLVLFLSYVPLHDIGASIILVTLVVKTILLPLNMSATRSQYALKKIEKELKNLREQYKNNKQEAGIKMMELYKKEKINPFASILAIALQIPVFIALYLVFTKGIQADPESLYSFIRFPESLHTNAFGFLDVTNKNIFVGILTGVSAYLLAKRQASTITVPEERKGEIPNFADSFQKSLKIQLLYVFPIIILITSSVLPAAIGIYWITGNIFSIIQDAYFKNKLAHHPELLKSN